MSLLSEQEPDLFDLQSADEISDAVGVEFRWKQLRYSLEQLGIASGRQGMSKAMRTPRRQEIQARYGSKTEAVVNGGVRNARGAEIRARDAFIGAYLGKQALSEEDTLVTDNPAYTQWVHFRNTYAGAVHAEDRESYAAQLSECIRSYEEANLSAGV